MINSGETALATTDDTAVAAFSSPYDRYSCRHIIIINEGSVAGWYTLNAGNTPYHRLPAGMALALDDVQFNTAEVKIKRTASGSNLGSVYISAW